MNKFSFYNPPIKNTTPAKTISLPDVVELIRTGKGFQDKIKELRRTQDEELKKKLPYVTFSGEFSIRKAESLIKHSGLLCMDIDHGQKVEKFDDYIPALIFVSPRGNGQKVVYQIDIKKGKHLEYFFALEGYFKQVHNIEVDTACKDVNRACWLSHDPELVYNEQPTVLDDAFIKKYKKVETADDIIEEKPPPGTRNNTLFEKALEASKEGKRKKEILEDFKQYIEDDFPLKEIKKIVNNAFSYKPTGEIPYIRVGVNFFKVIEKEDRHSVTRRELKPWNKDTIIEDHKRRYLAYVPKYDDFTMLPDNINYKPAVNGCFNLYAPFSHKPKKGDHSWSMRMMEHVFGDQLQQGLRYMQILYLHPERSTIVLVLVSKDNKTGKTTFCNWLHMLFGQNVALLSSSDFTSGFNSSYATKNLLIIEETLLEKKLTIEKLKSLVTSKYIQVNQKFVSPYKIPFHGKVVLTSNNVDKFALVDPKETRFFVRKLNKPSLLNANIEDDLLKEIPAFLDYLHTLPPVDWSIDRSGFTSDEIANENLRAVQYESRSSLYKDLCEYITDFFLNHEDKTELKATPKDIKEKWYCSDNRTGASYISKVLRDEFELTADKPSRYAPFDDIDTKVGRPYRFQRSYFVTEEMDEKNIENTEELTEMMPF